MRWSMKLALLTALAGAHLAWAQPEAPPDPGNAALELKSKLMYQRIDWGAVTLSSGGWYQDGRPMDVGFFLGNVDDYFGDVPEALQLARLAGSQRTLGFAFTMASLGLLLADCGLIVASGINTNGPSLGSLAPVFGAIAGVSLATSITGLVFTYLSGQNLMKAINRFNFGIIDKYLPSDQKLDFKLLIGSQMTGVGVRYTF